MKIVIIGATSAIAHATARHFAREHAEFYLVARSAEKLSVVSDDLKVWGAQRVETAISDAAIVDQHEELLAQAIAALGEIDLLLIAYGTLSDQKTCQASATETLKELNTNAISVISLLTLAANYFEARRRGCIAVISSVAGDRGRRSNYVYGTAKAAVSTFLQGLRSRLAKSGVAVITIKPGTVATPMTAHLRRGLLVAQPKAVGESIYEGIKKRRDVLYVPGYWRLIMFVVKGLPERLFKWLPL